MALYHKWGVKTGFTFALQFFMLISDGLGCVRDILGWGRGLSFFPSVSQKVDMYTFYLSSEYSVQSNQVGGRHLNFFFLFISL